MKWFDDKISELKMIYRGSDHSFTRNSWDDLCLDKGATLTVIEAENGSVFGGFTHSSWTKQNGKHGDPDDKAWIFSFDH
jgi:hypothetical protein